MGKLPILQEFQKFSPAKLKVHKLITYALIESLKYDWLATTSRHTHVIGTVRKSCFRGLKPKNKGRERVLLPWELFC